MKKVGGDLLLLEGGGEGDFHVLEIEEGILLLLNGGGGRVVDLPQVANGAMIWQRDALFYVDIVLTCLIALVLSNLVTTYSGLKKPECVMPSIECCYQNFMVL